MVARGDFFRASNYNTRKLVLKGKADTVKVGSSCFQRSAGSRRKELVQQVCIGDYTATLTGLNSRTMGKTF